MANSILINSTDLQNWAETIESQNQLPKLIRRLIRAVAGGIQKLDVPSDESVLLGGWDGEVEVATGTDFVPTGTSVWEFGVTPKIKGKADGDYKKRTANPDNIDPATSTFVFVTPRRWTQKAKWIKEKKKDGKWKDIKVYDADDLVGALETAPAVHIWASILTGKRPEGAIDVSNYWEEWSGVTNPKSTPELVIAGRTDAQKQIADWLEGQSSCLSLQAETQSEAVAFLVSCIKLLPQDKNSNVLERAVVVEQEVEWRRLALSPEPLVLIPTFGDRSLVASATQKGHHVFLPLGLAEPPATANVALKRPNRDDVYEALKGMNTPTSQIDDLATLGRRSSSSLRRRLAVNPSLLIPDWAGASEARALLPALLAGRWHDSSQGDRDAIAKLAGYDYAQVKEILLRWSNTPYPFIRQVGDVWMVVSKEDAWLLLSRYITGEDLNRFEGVILEVLGEVDPKYELEKERRMVAALFGKSLTYSPHLRAGLAENLALMGGQSDLASLADTRSGQDWADQIVFRLFSRATSWQLWVSLGNLLVPLAEASPEQFLDAVDKLLSGKPPIAVNLFGHEDGVLVGPAYTGLLWALELLAWSPEYISKVSLQLAQLARLDPGGRWVNRPRNSLREIFCIPFPNTKATPEQRLKIVDLVRKKEADVSWNLMISMIPEQRSSWHRTKAPEIRDWGIEKKKRLAWPDVFPIVSGVVSRLVQDVGTDASRWAALLSLIDDLQDDSVAMIIEKLKEVCDILNKEENEQLRECLRHGLREMISHHLPYPEAGWAMPRERLAELTQIYNGLEPEDLVLRHAWKFSYSNGFMLAEEDWDIGQEQKSDVRRDAVNEILKGGLDEILRLASVCAEPELLGTALGRQSPLGEDEQEFLRRSLGASDAYLVQLGRGYVNGRYFVDQKWIDTVRAFIEQGTPQLQTNFFLCLTSGPDVWSVVQDAGAEVEELYWRSVNIWGHRDLSQEELESFLESLINHKRLKDAIHYVAARSSSKKEIQLPPEFVLGMMEMAVIDGIIFQQEATQLVSDIPRLLKFVEQSSAVDDERLAQLEIIFLPWLEHSPYQPKAIARSLEKNPNSFCDLIKMAFRGEGEEKRELSADEEASNLRAYQILSTWRTIPGTKEDGSIDEDELLSWVSKAVELVSDCGRGIIGEQQIGQLLSHSPKGVDGFWPHEAVRRVIEDVGSEELETGFAIGTFNSRGLTQRGLTEGGDQERELESYYYSNSSAMRDECPRTSRMLKRMASDYNRRARGEDIDADLTQDLWR